MSQLEQYLAHLQRFGIVPGLGRIEALLALAGRPDRRYPLALVGGTNGKGSTCEFAARLLQGSAPGRRIGLYTSPHLYRWNERIRVLPGEGTFAGAISDEALDELLRAALPYIEEVAETLGQPTEFEVITFLGLWYFARQEVDAAIVEVGLGGRWDATNVTEPLVSVVTHVALDHCDRLGDTVEAIAADKVHIARRGRPFLTAETRPEVLAVFEDYCAATGARLQRVAVPAGPDFQQANWATATALAVAFCEQAGWAPLAGPSTHQPPDGVRGRFELLSGPPNLVIDGANNPDGALRLAQIIAQLHRIPRERLILVLGILADKDGDEMTRTLAPLAHTVIATQSSSPRAASASSIANVARAFCDQVVETLSVEEGVAKARALATSDDWIVVTGSFTTIAEVPRP